MKVLALLLCALAVQAQPVIQTGGVLDGAAYTPALAQGGIFVVKGAGLSPEGYVAAAPPFPTVINGAQVTLTPAGGGSATACYMVYAYNLNGVNQLAALAPSSLTPGDYNVTVTRAGQTSNAVRVAVAARSFGLITTSSDGVGMAVVQNFVSETRLDLNRFTTGTVGAFTTAPLQPGQTAIAWGIGLGPVRGKADNEAPGVMDLRGDAAISVLVGSREIPPDYAGRAPQFPGADQINFRLPPDIATGCAVPFQVRVNGRLSNRTAIAIAPAGRAACEHARFTPEQLARLDQGQTVVAGSFRLSALNALVMNYGLPVEIRTEAAAGGFRALTAAALASDEFAVPPAAGACYTFRQSKASDGSAAAAVRYLDAGDPLRLTGPNANGLPVPRASANAYFAQLSYAQSGGFPVPGPGGVPSTPVLTTGDYTLAGTGGAEVAAFTATARYSTPFTWLNRGETQTVVRANPLLVLWSGGQAADVVTIAGYAGQLAGELNGNPVYDTAAFWCSAPAAVGTFTIPAAVLQTLPAITDDINAGRVARLSVTLTPATPDVLSWTNGSVRGIQLQ